jgi:hypothetical protein
MVRCAGLQRRRERTCSSDCSTVAHLTGFTPSDASARNADTPQRGAPEHVRLSGSSHSSPFVVFRSHDAQVNQKRSDQVVFFDVDGDQGA